MHIGNLLSSLISIPSKSLNVCYANAPIIGSVMCACVCVRKSACSRNLIENINDHISRGFELFVWSILSLIFSHSFPNFSQSENLSDVFACLSLYPNISTHKTHNPFNLNSFFAPRRCICTQIVA